MLVNIKKFEKILNLPLGKYHLGKKMNSGMYFTVNVCFLMLCPDLCIVYDLNVIFLLSVWLCLWTVFLCDKVLVLRLKFYGDSSVGHLSIPILGTKRTFKC